MTSALSSLNTSPVYPSRHLPKTQKSNTAANDGQSDGIPTSSVRETLCNLRPIEIPRPKCIGFQFVPTGRRYGFYQSLTQSGAEKMGFNVKAMASSKRPSLLNEWQERQEWKEKKGKEAVYSVDEDENSEKVLKNYDKRLVNVTADLIPEESKQCKSNIEAIDDKNLTITIT